jgi:hypothetical protein
MDVVWVCACLRVILKVNNTKLREVIQLKMKPEEQEASGALKD